jgi:predicted RNase H-like HicB family nuclease
MIKYIAMVHKDPDSDYGVSFLDFPGLITGGTTLVDTRQSATEALAFHIEGMREAGLPIPEPTSFWRVIEIVREDRQVAQEILKSMATMFFIEVEGLTELDLAEQGKLPKPQPGETQDEANHRMCCALCRIPRLSPLRGTPLGDWLHQDDHANRVWAVVLAEIEKT